MVLGLGGFAWCCAYGPEFTGLGSIFSVQASQNEDVSWLLHRPLEAFRSFRHRAWDGTAVDFCRRLGPEGKHTE